MRYMFLIYSREVEPTEGSGRETAEVVREHNKVIDDAKAQGIFHGAEPLYPTSTATTVRQHDGKPLVIDGPFAETKEQLAGYYILDCKDLDEAIRWASRIPTLCKGDSGCVEIRPIVPTTPR